MTAPIRPTAAKTYGREKWAFVPAIASTGAPTVAELTAAGALDVSCYFYSDSAAPTVSQDGVTAPARVCDTQTFQSLGTATWSGGNALYVVDPQAAGGSNGKKALEKLPDGTSGFLVRRLGSAYATDFATGQFVDVFPVQFGVPVPVKQGDGDTGEVAIQQAYVVSGPPSLIVAVA